MTKKVLPSERKVFVFTKEVQQNNSAKKKESA